VRRQRQGRCSGAQALRRLFPILDALQIKNQFNDALQYLHRMDLGYISERIVSADEFVREAKQLARQAISSNKSLDAFLRKVNGYEKSGGKNAIKSAVSDLDRKLKSQERDNLTQITALDEGYFNQYLAGGKSPMRVYRDNGIDVNANSLDNYTFKDVVRDPGARSHSGKQGRFGHPVSGWRRVQEGDQQVERGSRTGGSTTRRGTSALRRRASRGSPTA
jgi:hypothetical protein